MSKYDNVFIASPGQKVRPEAVYGPEDRKKPLTWGKVRENWEKWFRSYDGKWIQFDRANKETGEVKKVKWPMTNSYQDDYLERYYARLKQLDRGLKLHWGPGNIQTMMLTFTASNRDGETLVEPADHINQIKRAYRKARQVLNYNLEGVEWEYVAVVEPHKSGYAHIHLAVFAKKADLGDGQLEQAGERALSSYVKNCRLAQNAAHKADGDEAALSINDDVENISSYISEYLDIYWDDQGSDLEDKPEYLRRFYALCWVTKTRRIMFSQGANEIVREQHEFEQHMEADYPKEDHYVMYDWLTGHIIDEKEETMFEITGSGGAVKLVPVNEHAKQELKSASLEKSG